MVAWRRSLLVASLVLLVDDDEAHVVERREQRRACAHHHVCQSLAHEVPLVVALPRREARVQHRHVVAKARPEASHGLRRKRDLGHKHERTLALRAHALDGSQVDLGLARPRDAIHKHHVTARRCAGGIDCLKGLLLAFGKVVGPLGHSRRERGLVASTHAAAHLHADRALRLQRRHRLGGAGKLGHAHGSSSKCREHRTLPAGVLAGLEGLLRLCQAHPAHVHRTRALAHQLPGRVIVFAAHLHQLAWCQKRAQRFAGRAGILARHPRGDAGRAQVKRRGCQHLLYGPDLVGRNPCHWMVHHRDHVAHLRTAREGDQHGAAHLHLALKLGGNGVVEGALKGAGRDVDHHVCVAQRGSSRQLGYERVLRFYPIESAPTHTDVPYANGAPRLAPKVSQRALGPSPALCQGHGN